MNKKRFTKIRKMRKQVMNHPEPNPQKTSPLLSDTLLVELVEQGTRKQPPPQTHTPWHWVQLDERMHHPNATRTHKKPMCSYQK